MKEKKALPFAPAIASFLQPFLEKAADHGEQWKTIVFKHDAQQTHLMVSRANSLTNAYPARKEEGEPRSRKNSNAYFYVFVLRSILFNNAERTYWIGTDKVWRSDGTAATEIDEKEMDTLERGVKIALSAENVMATPFKSRTKVIKEESSEDEDEDEDEEENSEAIGQDFVVDDDEDEEEEEDDEEPPFKRAKVDLSELKDTLDQSNALHAKLIEAIEAQTQVFRSFLEEKK